MVFDPANRDATVDIKGNLQGDASGAKLTDIIATFENVAQPQIITGEITSLWETRNSYDMSLSARWLDLDRLWVALAPASQAADNEGEGDKGIVPQFAPELAKEAVARRGPLAAARDLMVGLLNQLPTDSGITARFGAEQVNLGGESVADLNLRFTARRRTSEIRKTQRETARRRAAGDIWNGKN